MRRVAQFVFIALVLGLPAVASAGPAEDANVAVDRTCQSLSGMSAFGGKADIDWTCSDVRF